MMSENALYLAQKPKFSFLEKAFLRRDMCSVIVARCRAIKRHSFRYLCPLHEVLGPFIDKY